MVWFLGGTAVLCLLYYISNCYLFRCFDFVALDPAPCLAIFWDPGGWMVGLAASMRAESRVDPAFPSGQYAAAGFLIWRSRRF